LALLPQNVAFGLPFNPFGKMMPCSAPFSFLKQTLAVLAAFTLTPLFAASDPPANAFGPLKHKLQTGQDAVLFINGDSTAYPEFGPYDKFAKAIGEETKSKVLLYRWAEWEQSKPTGPKEYAAPVVLNEGAGGGTLSVYLAALPGGVAGSMFDASRRAKAMGEIPRPDCAILHQGHNMLNYSRAYPEDQSTARGLFLAALGNTAMQWPGVPQVLVTQNPWKGSDKYQGIYQPMLEVAALQPNVQLVDSHKLFVEAGKKDELYSDDIHPSAREQNSAGAALVSEALLAAWRGATPGDAGDTRVWTDMEGANLILNGDFAEWGEKEPLGWRAGEGATVEKVESDGHPALAIFPNGTQYAVLDKRPDDEEFSNLTTARTISVAALVRASSNQLPPTGLVVCPFQGETRTYNFGNLSGGRGEWMWLVASGIPVEEAPVRSKIYLRIHPAFGAKPPENNDPLLVRRVIVSEGSVPFGKLPAAP
jgi:hypothetical protein